nr:glycosyltransferase [uncultured Rhodococcus sp.]
MPVGFVSVIVPCFNGLPDLDVQLAALAAQDYHGEFEVIISDNGSTDGLREHLEQLESPLDIRWIDSSDVRGTPHARNSGIEAARGDFLVFTDQDDAVYPNWLTALARAAEKYDAVGGPIEVQTLNSPDVATWRAVPAPEDRFETTYLPYAHGNNFGMWRYVVDQVGTFDESFLGGGEDLDYSWRIQQAGLTLGHESTAMVAYRLRDTTKDAFVQGIGYGAAWVQVATKHRTQGCPNPPALWGILAHVWTMAVLGTVRNPLLPPSLKPMPRGQWAQQLGQQYGALRMRVASLRGPVSRRQQGQ